MAADREGIFAALFERVQASVGGAAGVGTFVRRALPYDDACNAEQPVVCLVKGRERFVKRDKGLPPLVTLEARLEVLVRVPEGDGANGGAAQVELHRVLTAIERALERLPSEPPASVSSFPAVASWSTTLGGRCASCMIVGDIETDEGAMGGQGLAVVPLEIITTS